MREHLSATSAKLAARRARVLIAATGTALLAACGAAGATPASAPAGTGFPVTVTGGAGSSVTLTKRPSHIVSLSPTATEMLFAIDAGPQVTAVDDQSNYPASAPKTRLSGFQPNLEAITTYAPDLVVASDNTGGLAAGLKAAGIPLLLEPAAKTLDDAYAQIEQLGTATGRRANADSVVRKMRSDIASTVSSLHRQGRQLSVYHELDDTHFSATSHTFIGQAYALLGLRDIADGASGAVPDYPQLSAEYIVSANPDLIVLADTKCCHQDAQTVAQRPGWGVIAAVRQSEVVAADDDVASRWGPRIVDFLRLVARHVIEVERRSPAAGG
jgi:iron complex transport system substrate-binding protein